VSGDPSDGSVGVQVDPDFAFNETPMEMDLGKNSRQKRLLDPISELMEKHQIIEKFLTSPPPPSKSLDR